MKGTATAALLCLILLLVGGFLAADESGRPLIEVLREENLELQWDPLRSSATIWRGTSSVTLALGEERVLLNYSNLYSLPDPALRRVDGVIHLSRAAIEELPGWLPEAPVEEDRRVIAGFFIDPGHGGRDPGTIGRHTIDGAPVLLQEKDLVLDAALRLRDQLRRRYPEKQVIMSRDTDVYLTLEERTRRANALEVEPDETVIFISIHANASLNSRADGFEVWYLPPEYRRGNLINPDRIGVNDPEVLTILNTIREEEVTLESILLGRNILAGLEAEVGSLSPNRGLKEESWYVVRNARMPSVLVELGFVTNQGEFLRLRDEAYLNKLVNGIYTGLTNFVQSFETYGRE
ncbi:MAG: N-acetylmuramoyl-L-alanine amidase family protein [Alkalispirochaetaceae bacterium]